VRLLLDTCVGSGIAAELQAAGHDVDEVAAQRSVCFPRNLHASTGPDLAFTHLPQYKTSPRCTVVRYIPTILAAFRVN